MTNSHRRGPWSSSEDAVLLRLIGEGPPLNWVKISEEIQTRSPKQCRERFYQNLKPNLDHSPITPEEGRIIESLVETIGRRWADIARQLNGRSDNAVKNWWNGNQNRRRRAALRRNANAAATAGNASAAASNASVGVYPTAAVSMARAPAHTHQRNASIEDLYEAAEHQAHTYHLHESYSGRGYAHVDKDESAYRGEQRQLPVPAPLSQNDSSYYEARRPTSLTVHRPEPQQPSRDYTYQQQQYQPYHEQQQQQQQQQESYHSQYAASQYQYRPRHVQTTSNSTPADFFSSARRMSVAVASPSADSVDQGPAPSLISDTGSPSLRGSSSHACSSPALELPPLLNINGATSKPSDDSYSASALTPTLPSLTGASRTWNDRSAPSSANHSPARATFAPDEYAHRVAPTTYYSRESSAVPVAPAEERLTPEVKTAALAIMNLPEYAHRQAQNAEKKGERAHALGLRDLLN